MKCLNPTKKWNEIPEISCPKKYKFGLIPILVWTIIIWIENPKILKFWGILQYFDRWCLQMTEKAFLIFGFAPKFLKPMNMYMLKILGFLKTLNYIEMQAWRFTSLPQSDKQIIGKNVH